MWGKSAEGWGGGGRIENVGGEDLDLVRED